jgi:hypothetical protein
MDGSTLKVSWGGRSDWEPLNTVNASITDLAVGKFGNHVPGDRRDDIFWADGTQWYISSDATGPFRALGPSSFRVKDLRFGDFDGDGVTDVLGIVAGKWMVSYGAIRDWAPLAKSLTNTMDGVVVADFDGDGKADIATSTLVVGHGFPGPAISYTWQFSSAGVTDWITRSPLSGGQWPVPIAAVAGIGNFDGKPGADILFWGNDQHVDIVPGGTLQGSVASPIYSRQDLR